MKANLMLTACCFRSWFGFECLQPASELPQPALCGANDTVTQANFTTGGSARPMQSASRSESIEMLCHIDS